MRRMKGHARGWSRLAGAGATIALSLVACAELGTRGIERYDREQLAASLAAPGERELVIGVFPLAKGAVVDGDTIKVDGLDASLRLLALDTEETFKSEAARRDYEKGWDVYIAAEKAKTSRPIKVPTPAGEQGKKFAKEFFEGVRRVRLERDHPKEIRGRFNRYLAYVFAEKQGEWVNYNVEAVRAGISPYFTKYAYSRRFHDEFVEAQAEARAAQRGIWAPGGEHYDDYDLRLAWWNARAGFIAQFEHEAQGNPDMVVLTHWDATRQLAALVDREVEVLATVGSVQMREGKAPARVMLSRRMFADLPLIFWDEEVLEASKIAQFKGEFVRVRGLVSEYENKRTGRSVLQIEVRMPAQVQLAPYVPPGKRAEDLARPIDATRAPRVRDTEAPKDAPTVAPESATAPTPQP